MTVTISFDSPSTFVLDGPGVNAWRKTLGVRVPGAEFSPAFRRKIWDGMQYPGTRGHGGVLRFGRGYLHRAIHDLNATIIKPPPAAPEIREISVPGLRDYQTESLRLIVQKKWGRIALATNAGKGAVIAIACQTMSISGRTCLVLCDEIAVFQALRQEITKWALREPVCIEAGSLAPPPADRGAIVLAMVPTLTRRKSSPWLDWMKNVDAVFLDEADKATAPTWQSLLRRMTNTHFRIGFSGTFFDENTPSELTLAESLGPVLLRMSNSDMIERHISARPFVELVPFTHRIKNPPGWWEMPGPVRRQAIFREGIITNQARHEIIRDLLDPSEPNAVIVNYIEHGQELLRALPDSRFLSGDAPKDLREAVLADFKAGRFQNLIVSKILDRGTNDLGHTVGLIFASGMGSNRQTLQRVGRGLRRAGGKEFLFLKDILDRGHKYFDAQSRKRVILYNHEGFDVTLRAPGV